MMKFILAGLASFTAGLYLLGGWGALKVVLALTLCIYGISMVIVGMVPSGEVNNAHRS